jgi:hypothetical protein
MYHYQTSQWIRQTGASNMPTSTSFSYTGYTGTFSPFSITDGFTALPLTWLSFTAQKINQAVLLKWQTANERNTRDFVVQHSTDLNAWQSLTVMNAANHSATMLNYEYVDQTPAPGINYYRILQRDKDGHFSYSKIVSISMAITGSRWMVYPNPVYGQTVNIMLPNATQINLYNSTGALMISRYFNSGLHQLDVGRLPKGIYLLRADKASEKIVVQ